MADRIEKLSTDPIIRTICNMGERWITRVKNIVQTCVSTKQAFGDYHASKLEISYSGNGMNEMEPKTCSSFIYNPPLYWTGQDYIKAILLRFNLLPTKGIPSNPRSERLCRGCQNKSETLCHVIQGCETTHWERIAKHNFVLKRLASAARQQNWRVNIEPRIRGADGILLIPDLIIEKNNTTIISDVGIHWEGPEPLALQYQHKVAKYSTNSFIDKIKQIYPNNNIRILPFILGARGGWCKLNNFIADEIKMTLTAKQDSIHTAMRGSWLTHQSFMRRVWG